MTGAARPRSDPRIASRLVLLYLVLVLVHAAMGASMRQPHIFPDELAYLGQARYLARSGLMPDMGMTHYYHFGYAALIAPALAVFEAPVQAYRAAIAINALMLSALFPLLHVALSRSLGVPPARALVLAFVTCLYPAFLLQSNFAWAENALIPGYALSLVAFGALLRRGTAWRAAAFSLAAGCLYALHPRALPLVPLAALVLVALARRHTVPWRSALTGVCVLALTFASTVLVGRHLHALGWSDAGHGRSAVRFVSRTLSADGLLGSAMALAGQTLYLSLSTFGLFLVAAGWLFAALRTRHARSGEEDTHRTLFLLFVALSTACLLATSAAAMLSGDRPDHFVYGRYNEMFLPLWIAIGLTIVSSPTSGRADLRRPALVLIAIAGLTALVVAYRGEALRSRDLVVPNIFGIYAFVRAAGHLDLTVTALGCAVVFLVSTAAFRRSPAAGLAIVALAFTAGTVAGYRFCTFAQAWIVPRDAIPARIRQMGRVPRLSYDISQPIVQTMDLSQQLAARYFSTQYLLPDTRVQRFSSARGEVPTEPVVVSTRAWRDAPRLQARYVTSEPGAVATLWLLPSSWHYRSASERYTDVRLGWRTFPGVWESGFYRADRRTARLRWTNGRARLIVPVNEFPARLVTDLTPARPDLAVRILVNGVELWNAPYPAGARSFDLSPCPVTDWVTVELLSDTTERPRRRGSARARRVGIGVREIRLATG